MEPSEYSALYLEMLNEQDAYTFSGTRWMEFGRRSQKDLKRISQRLAIL